MGQLAHDLTAATIGVACAALQRGLQRDVFNRHDRRLVELIGCQFHPLRSLWVMPDDGITIPYLGGNITSAAIWGLVNCEVML